MNVKEAFLEWFNADGGYTQEERDFAEECVGFTLNQNAILFFAGYMAGLAAKEEKK